MRQSRVEVLDLFFDFESLVSAVFLLKCRGQIAILSQAQSQNVPNFCRDGRNLVGQSRNILSSGLESRNIGRAYLSFFLQVLIHFEDFCSF